MQVTDIQREILLEVSAERGTVQDILDSLGYVSDTMRRQAISDMFVLTYFELLELEDYELVITDRGEEALNAQEDQE